MRRRSAGLLMFRVRDRVLEVLLVHPGGPFWTRKDEGAWSIPKGEYADDEEPLAAARREFDEETGFSVDPPFIALKPARQRSGKLVSAWAFAGNAEPTQLVSNTFEMEWPARSGRMAIFPEVDRAGWFALPEARRKINEAQVALLDELASIVQRGDAPPAAAGG